MAPVVLKNQKADATPSDNRHNTEQAVSVSDNVVVNRIMPFQFPWRKNGHISGHFLDHDAKRD